MTDESRWRSFLAISTKEAAALLDEYVAGLPARIEEFFDEAWRWDTARRAPPERAYRRSRAVSGPMTVVCCPEGQGH
jgi:hypothetical protein